MVLTNLVRRTAARSAVLGRVTQKAQQPAFTGFMAPGAQRFGGDYNWNLGVPGSRIRNPDPEHNNEHNPGQGVGWYCLIGLSFTTWVTGNLYDMTRPVNVALGLFGVNAPL
mmetsp:Transcript_60953/g.178786  ORF Transcript_60953/g.178786 Transcript_60953/m.178786 type:complete len:111 (+) Transcript_60953:70-402(+)